MEYMSWYLTSKECMGLAVNIITTHQNITIHVVFIKR